MDDAAVIRDGREETPSSAVAVGVFNDAIGNNRIIGGLRIVLPPFWFYDLKKIQFRFHSLLSNCFFEKTYRYRLFE